MTIMIPTWVDGALVPVEKLEAHQKGLRHKAISVFLLSDDMVLLQQRALEKYHTPGLWANTCCTHPAWNEDPRECALRRLDEELGITGVNPIWREKLEYRADVGNGLTEHEVVDVFVVHTKTRPQMAPDPAEVMATDWMTLDALCADVADNPTRYTPWLQIYLRDFKRGIFGDLLGGG